MPVCVHVCEMIYVCVHDCEGPRTKLNIILRNTIHFLLRHRFSMAWRLPIMLRCLVRESQGPTFPGWDCKYNVPCLAVFMGSGNRTQVFRVTQQALYGLNRLPSPIDTRVLK